jgi:alginate O-acetyltransferase complex protein AlgI
MVFSSILFIFVFLPVFLIVYHLSGQKLKNYVLLLSSIIFYAWGAPKFIFLLLLSLIINFFVVQRLYKSRHHKKGYLLLSVFINLGLLAFFKYANFFIGNVNFVLASFHIKELAWTKIALPIGISFFTFQSLTYTVDVYRNVHKPLDKLTDYLLYILMFPQLIAGPIVRFNTIADDIIDRRKNESIDNKLLGIYRFVIGLSKKVLIANILGEQVDAIYSMPLNEVDSTLAWMAVIAYSFQIYFDFSGYSDMAIGLGKILGFNFPENFNNPYISGSITEFWRRWHMTLSAWMKDYLYIPLGGNRVRTKSRLFFNLWVVFLLSGLWHGASWNFVLWGAWHGFFLILDRLFLKRVLAKTGKIPSMLITYFIVLIGWVFFRIENFKHSIFYLGQMFRFEFKHSMGYFKPEFLTIFILATVFSFIAASKPGRKAEIFIYEKNYSTTGHMVISFFAAMFLIISVSYIAASGFNPFIYFRF